ncbi:MAG: helix-turn-helix domain-containing protein [Eubacteriales bacterium]
MIDKTLFGRQISVLRKKHGLSQAALAERLGITSQAVSKWECGTALPDIETLAELSYLFDVSMDRLLSDCPAAFSGERKTGLLPESVCKILRDKEKRKVLSALTPYCTEEELSKIAVEYASGRLRLTAAVTAEIGDGEYLRTSSVPLEGLHSLDSLSPIAADVLNDFTGSMERGLRRMLAFLRCPSCGAPLTAAADGKRLSCACGRNFDVDHGVVYFGSREIKGELWSLYLRNYDAYLREVESSGNPVYSRGEVRWYDVVWKELQKRRPRVILDVASGTAGGLRTYLHRIDWNCTVILCDLSYRILAYDRRYIMENVNNPYVEMAYLACDCANLPLKDGSVDCVVSCAGFESMQKKMRDGYREAYRILKKDGIALYTRALLSDKENPNVRRWMKLMQPVFEEQPCWISEEDFYTVDEWKDTAAGFGFRRTDSVKIYGELPAPETDTLPFENEVLQWMSEYVCMSYQ